MVFGWEHFEFSFLVALAQFRVSGGWHGVRVSAGFRVPGSEA